MNDQKEQILAGCRAETHKHEFEADSDRRRIQELSGIIDSQRREIDHTHARGEQLRRDLREAHMKSLNEMEELKRIQGSTFETVSRRKINRRSRHYP